MKWYKKQLDKLKASKPESSKTSKPAGTKNTLGRSFDARKIIANKNTFSNPVAASKRNRPKTDSI